VGEKKTGHDIDPGSYTQSKRASKQGETKRPGVIRSGRRGNRNMGGLTQSKQTKKERPVQRFVKKEGRPPCTGKRAEVLPRT